MGGPVAGPLSPSAGGLLVQACAVRRRRRRGRRSPGSRGTGSRRSGGGFGDIDAAVVALWLAAAATT
jgi:hypothetical protein